MAQAARSPSGSPARRASAAGKSAVELGLDERDDVDAIDPQEALALGEPRSVDVRPLHIDGAHHDAGQVSPDEPGATQVRVDELRTLQVTGPGEGRHASSSSWHLDRTLTRTHSLAVADRGLWWQGHLLREAELLGRCCYRLVEIQLLRQVDRVRVSVSCRLRAQGSGLGVLRALTGEA